MRPPEMAAQRRADTEIRGGSYQWFIRGKGHIGEVDDFKVETRRKKRLRDYDKFLKCFQYANALDAVLSTVRC